MHKHILTILFVLLIITTSLTQETWIASGEPGSLTPPDKYFMQPICSPEGKKIAVAGKNYEGIWIMDANGQNLQQLTDEVGAGYRFEWSSDSKQILTRVTNYKGPRRLNVIKVFNVENSESRVIKEFMSSIYGLPKWTADNKKICILTKNGLESFESKKTVHSRESAVKTRQNSFYISRDVFYVVDSNGNEVNSFKPVAGSYLNAVISPDGQKIAFQVVGGHMFVINIDGSGLVDLGPGERPRWSPDNAWLVYMIPIDDGHQILSSDIFAIKVDGTGKTKLTQTEDQLEMNPYWSPDGHLIVFDEKKSGRIYLLRIQKQ